MQFDSFEMCNILLLFILFYFLFTCLIDGTFKVNAHTQLYVVTLQSLWSFLYIHNLIFNADKISCMLAIYIPAKSPAVDKVF